ncbi:MAG: Lrp/AsnC ligand binding domain-containing protein [Bacteroidales bacterium]|nr:Lrp/AsnC ligand binding domain-containing protein [Bacteroidales bacterium]
MGLKIDSLDKRILSILTRDARVPFLEIARKCNVSGAAIHQRVNQMLSNKVVSGSQFNVDPIGLGYGTCAFVGLVINLKSVYTHNEVFKKISEVPEITECHHVTGKYSLFVKIYAKSNEHLRKLITDKIQAIPEITNTETFISLEVGFQRQLPVES